MAQAWCENLHLACSEEHAVRELHRSCEIEMQHRAADLLRRVLLIPLMREDGLFMPFCMAVQ